MALLLLCFLPDPHLPSFCSRPGLSYFMLFGVFSFQAILTQVLWFTQISPSPPCYKSFLICHSPCKRASDACTSSWKRWRISYSSLMMQIDVACHTVSVLWIFYLSFQILGIFTCLGLRFPQTVMPFGITAALLFTDFPLSRYVLLRCDVELILLIRNFCCL